MERPVFGDPETWDMTVDQYLDNEFLVKERENFNAGGPVLTASQKKQNLYNKLLQNLPEGYLEDYKNTFLKDRGDGTFSRKSGEEGGVNFMKEKYGDEIKKIKTRQGYTKNIGEKIKQFNNAILKDLNTEGLIVSGLKDKDLKRTKNLKEIQGRAIKFKAPKGYQAHHMLPITSRAGMTDSDISVISKEMNTKLSKYNKPMNKLVEESMNLDFNKEGSLKRMDQINKELANYVNKAEKELPKKYKGLIGFNKLTPVLDTFDEKGQQVFGIERLGTDYKKSIGGKKVGTPLKDISTINIQKQIANAPKFKSEFIPGMNKAADYVSSTIEDLMKLRLGSAALKSLPIAGAAYTVYDTGVGLKEGRSVPELLTRTFGLDPLYRKGIQYAALSDEAQEAQKNINYQKSLEASLQDPLDESLMGLAPRQENTEAQLTQLANEQRIIDERMKQADDIRAQEREGIMNLIKNKIMGTPIQTTNFLAAGGRVGYADGSDPKDPKMNRRTFMKLMGGIASIPFLGKFAKPVSKAVTKAAPVIQENIAGAPAHFWNLVNKIKLLGDDVTQTGALAERQSVKKYKDFELVEDTATGQIDIQRYKVLDDDSEAFFGKPLTEETYMSYKPGKGQADEMTGPIPDDYEEGRSLIRNDRGYSGEIVDEIPGVSDDVIEEAMGKKIKIK